MPKPSLEEVVREATTAQSLRGDLNRALMALSKEKAKKADIVAAVYDAAHAAVAGMDLKPVAAPKLRKSSKGEEVAAIVLSDWQLGKVTPSYNSKICAERVDLMATKVMELTEIQRSHHPVRNAHIWLLGDLVEGEMIFPGQPWLVDASLYAQVQDAACILERFIRRMLTYFETVEVTGVIGNHGSIGGLHRRDYNPETNFDRLAYSITRMLFDRAGETRVKFNIPEGGRERNWWAIDKIGAYGAFMFHGDQIKGHGGIPFYGFKSKVPSWFSGAIPGINDPAITTWDAYCGHFHVPTRLTYNNITVRISGSTESDNTFAQEFCASMGRPSQQLLFVRPDKGRVSSEYTVWLD